MRSTYHVLNAKGQENNASVIFSLYNKRFDFASSYRVVDSSSIAKELGCWEYSS